MQKERKKFTWNPSISKAQAYLYSKDVAYKTKGVRLSKIKGKDETLKIKETISKDIDVRPFSKLFLFDSPIIELEELNRKNLERVTSLSNTAIKVLFYIISSTAVDRDYVSFSNKKCGESIKLSYNSVRIGVRELLDKEFIFDSYRDGEFWIDCTFFYNGNFEKKSEEYLNAKK